MQIRQLLRAKTLWIVGSLAVIGLVAAILAWQLRLAHLRTVLVDDSLLSDMPCAAPCWQGITPGETSRSQAMQILMDSPYIYTESVEEAGNSEVGGVTWWWSVPGRRLQPSIRWQNDIVQQITLGLTYDLTVDQVVSKFGPPDALHVGTGGVPEHSYWVVDVYYTARGIQVKAYTPEFSDALETSTEVGVVIFFAPCSLEERVVDIYCAGNEHSTQCDVSDIVNSMYPWRGYGDLFEIYYESSSDLRLEE